jgi:hypothetical protein
MSFSGKDGVFMDNTTLKINGLGFFAQIRRHSSPDYQTFSSPNLSWA